MSKLGGNAHQKYVQTMLQQQAQADMPKPNWTPLRHDDVRMKIAIARCADYRVIRSLNLDDEK